MFWSDQEQDSYPLSSETDPRIRIPSKIKRIRNTNKNADVYLQKVRLT